MRRTLLASLVLVLSACGSDPPATDAAVTDRPSVADVTDVTVSDVTVTDVSDANAPADTGDATASDVTARDASDAATTDVTTSDASDAAGDTPDVMLRNGCPVLTDPVDRMGAAPMGDTWADFARPFFVSWCTRCHSTTLTTAEMRRGAPDGFNWDDEASVRRELARIRAAVGVDNYMPLTPPNPSCDERRRLIRWIDIGAP